MLASRNLVRLCNSLGRRSIHTSFAANMPIKAGDKLPAVDLFDGKPDVKVNTGAELSKGKTVIFGVPGAFTPTCSNDHVPNFLSSIDDLKAKGVSNVVCVSVNDPFVMEAWGKGLDPGKKIRFLADTCGEFTKACDLSFDVTAVLGNVRCKRFALVAEDGVVKGINVEDGGGYSCSKPADVLGML